MRVLIFGATGMVGQGVLRECLLDPAVQRVVTIGRHTTGVRHPKLQDVVHRDMWHYEDIADQLTGFDACFFCLGITSLGMAEADYTHITYDITMAAATTLVRLNPRLTFVYVSGAGTDSSEQGRIMWARVKGKTENALLRMPFAAAFIFRPGAIQPLHGARSKTTWVHTVYVLTSPVLSLLRWMFPRYILTTEQIGRAMINIVSRGASTRVLEAGDIGAVARA